jgi:nucleoside-diphosphate-sugar epimerase
MYKERLLVTGAGGFIGHHLVKRLRRDGFWVRGVDIKSPGEELISIDGLVDLVSKVAGKKLIKRHDLSKPQGVRGRNSDNSRLRQVGGWEPSISLEQGLAVTYRKIQSELAKANRIATKAAHGAHG